MFFVKANGHQNKEQSKLLVAFSTNSTAKADLIATAS